MASHPRRTLRTSARAALALLGLLCVPAEATFVRSVMDQVDAEPLFNEGYFINLRSFAWPRAWDDAWSSSTGGYRANGASLDCCALYLDQGLVFARRLTAALEFRFRYTDLEDKDRQETHHWLELEQDLGRGFSAELFGETAFRKEDADIGLGLRWRREGWQLRARRNAVDFNFNERGSTAQSYSKKPWTDELLVEAPLGAAAARLACEVDHPTRLELPGENRVFAYRRTRLWAGVGAPQGARVDYSYEFQTKSNRFPTPAAGRSEESRRQVHGLTASTRLRPSEKDEFEPGLGFFVRAARADRPDEPQAGTFYRRWEIQPWLRWRRELTRRATTELAPFLSLGENRVRHPGGGAPEEYHVALEAKLGAGLDLAFGPSARIGFYATFKVDTPSHPWGGGNIRAMFLF